MQYFTVLVVLFIVSIVWYVGVLNQLRVISIKVEEAESGIDIALTKRYDVLTKMLSVVKGYAEYEQETLTKVIDLRQGMPIRDKQEVLGQMNTTLRGLQVTVEHYPQLRASENYRVLQVAIMDTEEHLQASRRLYNASVSLFNQSIAIYPNKFVADANQMVKKEFFEIEEMKKEDVEMIF